MSSRHPVNIGFIMPSQHTHTHTHIPTHPHTSMDQTHIIAAKDGRVKTVFYALKDNVPRFSKVIEFEED